MGLQTIIDNATYISINKRKGTGLTVSRSGHVKTSTAQGSVYRFTVGMHAGLKYSTNRDLLEDLDSLDRTVESNISLNNNTGMNYLTALLGGTTGGTFSINSTDGANIYVDCSSVTGSTTLFKKGDFIQPKGNTDTYRYPYQVTSDVSWNGTSVTVPLHRAFISQSGYSVSGKTLLKGTAVTWRVKMMIKPSYSIVPHDRLEFDADFELIEVIE